MMKELVLSSMFVGNWVVTSYRSTAGQTDSSPFITSTGEHVGMGGIAISQDVLCGACRKLHHRCAHPEYEKKIHYGDALYIEDVGVKIVNDCMGKWKHYRVPTNHGSRRIFIRQNEWLDIWVPAYKDEHHFHKRFGIKRHKIWRIYA